MVRQVKIIWRTIQLIQQVRVKIKRNDRERQL